MSQDLDVSRHRNADELLVLLDEVKTLRWTLLAIEARVVRLEALRSTARASAGEVRAER